jgi:hypothetical protein
MEINYKLEDPEVFFSSFNKALTINYAKSLSLSVEDLRLVQNNINRAILYGSDKIRYFFNSEIKFNAVITLFNKLDIYYSIFKQE